MENLVEVKADYKTTVILEIFLICTGSFINISYLLILMANHTHQHISGRHMCV